MHSKVIFQSALKIRLAWSYAVILLTCHPQIDRNRKASRYMRRFLVDLSKHEWLNVLKETKWDAKRARGWAEEMYPERQMLFNVHMAGD